MKKHLIGFGLLLCGLTVNGQSIDRSAVSSSGSIISNSSITLEFTVGEAYAGELNNSSASLTTGFVQSYKPENSSIVNVSSSQMYLLFPNPAQDELNLVAQSPCKVKIVNVLGETVSAGSQSELVHKFNVSHFVKGVYFVEVTQGATVTYSKWVKD